MTNGKEMSQFMKNINKIRPQVRRTYEWIFEAFLILIQEKEPERITVCEITKKAGVARQTFYRNYTNKNDIIQKYIDLIFLDFVQSIEDRHTCKDICLCYFETLYQHKHSLISLIKYYDAEIILKTFSRYIDVFIRILSQDESKIKKNSNPQYQIMYQVGGTIFITSEWIQKGMQSSVKDMANLVKRTSSSNYFFNK
ncbi:TetR/AcrR family transcriptional regulator [Vagococcus entomophilus]|uniref:HTH tetR-type domain-containing protein n=2 Tax=Vagococcus entomophilus TaxID=1160095 RepID=A0A430AIN4_9ENTE|nr:TetR/AcrR family transcriptional regulator [Vagococcus entomophilus]RSU07777.1 hypothetical protein CBF30_00630 [Vagococcus entomophilus]